MSGVYIKGIELPENCVTDDCPCVNREMGFCQADPEGRYVYGYRPYWCPLIPVLDHGRLIDADAAAKHGWTISRTYSASPTEMVYEVKTMTDEVLPTIIPADEGEDA